MYARVKIPVTLWIVPETGRLKVINLGESSEQISLIGDFGEDSAFPCTFSV